LVFPYGQLEAHVAAHPFDFDDDGDVDAQDIAAGTSGGTCWGDYDGASGDCKRLDADGDRDIDVDDYTIINNFLAARHSEAALQRIPAASHSRRGNLFAHQGLPLDAELASYQNRARQYAPARGGSCKGIRYLGRRTMNAATTMGPTSLRICEATLFAILIHRAPAYVARSSVCS
jgi:hypothetical protein